MAIQFLWGYTELPWQLFHLFFLLRFLSFFCTIANLHTQRAALMQVPELQKFLRHGVKSRGWENVVIIMVADWLLIQSHRKWPETISGNLFTQAKGKAHQEQPCGQAFAVDAVVPPESTNIFKEVRVGKQDSLVGGGVCKGVVCPQGGVSAGFHGEGWYVDVARAICLHTLYKGFAGP